MATKKYLSLERLAEYDALLKAKITADDAAILAQAKTDASNKDAVVLAEAQKGINAVQLAVDTLSGNLQDALDGKADSVHNHDDIYYTEAEIDAKLALKCDAAHNHDGVYEQVGLAEILVNNHDTDNKAHSDIRQSISDLSTQVNNFLDVDDATKDQLSEVLTLIDNNKGTLESLTTSKVNVSDIVDDLTTANAKKVLSANQGVVINTRLDAIAEETLGNIQVVSMSYNWIDDISDEGIICSGNGTFDDGAERTLCSYSANSFLPIIAGNNITFELANENRAVEINANIEEITSAEIQALFNATT